MNQRVTSRDLRTIIIGLLSLTLLTSAWIALVASSASAGSRTPWNATLTANATNGTLHNSQEWEKPQVSSSNSSSDDDDRSREDLQHIVFGIAGSAKVWASRREVLRLWWREGMRGFIWLDDPVPPGEWDSSFPPIRISEDTSTFRYTNVDGDPSGIRIARIVLETMRMNLTGGFEWLVLCDDDTIFSTDNLVRVLSNYNSSEMFYIGSVSESHGQNVAFSHKMAFGGGGIAMSYPLVRQLASMLDKCLRHYPQLTGSDDRLYACISELGVPLTREPGFHQMDIRGSPLGLLSTHPVTPFVTMHHFEAMDPVFPEKNRLEGLRLLVKAMNADSSNFLQQSIGYHRNQLTFSISTGYVVQVFEKIVYPRVLEKAEITFQAWSSRTGRIEFDLDTRKADTGTPHLFFLNHTYVEKNDTIVSEYKLYKPPLEKKCRKPSCWSRMLLPGATIDGAKSLGFETVRVFTKPLSSSWYKVPRRQCCHFGEVVDGTISVTVSPCEPGETLFTS